VKVVHIELPDKTSEVAMLEIKWKHFFAELIRVEYNEFCTV